MATTQTIRIVIEERGSKQAAQNIRGIASAATAGDKALGLLKAAVGAVVGGTIIRQYVELSNTYQTLQNRIRLVTTSQQEQIAVTRELLAVSNSTFTSLKDTTELYARLAFNTRNLGLTQAEVLQVTKTLNQAVLLSGAGAREASNAIIQLSQGLASGTLRGDELRSVLEQLPFVADVIAQSLEVDRSALRRLGAEGEITSEKIVRGLLKAGEQVDAEAKNRIPTIGQAFTNIENNILAAVGEFNNATGASESFAKTLLDVAGGIEDVTDIAIAGFQEIGGLLEGVGFILDEVFGPKVNQGKITFRDVLRFIAAAIDGITGVFRGTGEAIIAFWSSVGNNLKVIFLKALNAILAGLEKVTKGFETAINFIIDQLNEVATIFGGDKLKRVSFEQVFGRFDEGEFVEVGKEIGGAFLKGFNESPATDFLNDVLARADARKAARAAEGRDLGGKVRNPQEGQVAKTANDLLILQLAEQLKAEEKLLSVRSTGTALEIAQAQALKKFNEDVKKDKIILNDEQREELELMVKANAERKVRNDLDKQLSQFNQALDDELALLKLNSQEREVQADLLQVINASREAGIALDAQELESLRQKRIAIQQLATEQEILNRVFGDQAKLQDEIAATQRLRDAETDPNRRRGLERLQAEQRLASRQGDPSLIAGFENGLDQLFLKVSDVAGGIEQAMTNAFSAAEDALVQFVQTGEFNFSGFVDSILADITRLLARQAVLAIFNAATGGTSGAFGGVISALAGARAEGGPVTRGESFLVGERGPEIFTPNQSGTIVPNNALPAAAPTTNISVVNVVDPNMVSAALNDPQNEQVIVNIIGKHRTAVNRSLGNG
ncbi:MAG: tape measure protein [Phycisphaerales bacterium]|nr:tape measure protein [Phycisphaerales bacterium]